MRRLCLAIFTVVCAGCAASPEVKQASAEVGTALRELNRAQRSFGNAYQAEIDEIRKLISQSILNDAVNRKVDHMVDASFDGDLVRLSAAMRNERDAASRRVQLVASAKAPTDSSSDPIYPLKHWRYSPQKSLQTR